MAASRYVDDVPYERTFIPELSPAWLDLTALLWGFAPVDRSGPLAWCDMGCGQGVNAVVLAATHPQGRFYGVDAMSTHIEHATGLARDCGADNAAFHAVDFGAALELDLPQFDYITAHGVYSWVDDRARADLVRFIDARLKPGGRVYLSYNALPGRAADEAFQHLILTLSDSLEGDSIAKVKAALAVASRMAKVNTPSLLASPMAQVMLKSRRGLRGDRYLAHELLNPHWRPLSVAEMRRDLGAIGLTPAGSATLMDNFDSYMLTAAAQRILAGVEDTELREVVRDYLVNASFRRDVFVREPQVLSEDARVERLHETKFALLRPAAQVAYRFGTPAGEVGFDNAIARAIVRMLAAGPASLSEANLGDDALANLLALAAAGQVVPVEDHLADVGPLNREVAARLGGPDNLRLVALGCGAVLQPPGKVLDALKGGARGAAAAWARHLAAYGAGFPGG